MTHRPSSRIRSQPLILTIPRSIDSGCVHMHAVKISVLVLVFYVSWTLVPVESSPLSDMTPLQLREEIAADSDTLHMLRKAADDIVNAFAETRLLERSVDALSQDERNAIRSLWRDGVMVFYEFEINFTKLINPSSLLGFICSVMQN